MAVRYGSVLVIWSRGEADNTFIGLGANDGVPKGVNRGKYLPTRIHQGVGDREKSQGFGCGVRGKRVAEIAQSCAGGAKTE